MKRFLLVFIGLWISGVVLAQSGNLVQPDNMKVRSGPGESFISIGALFAGDAVIPLNRSQDGAWVLISYGRGVGWVQRQSVTWQDNIDALAVMAPNVTPTPMVTSTPVPAVAEESPLVGIVLLTDADRAFVRSGPGRGYSRLGQLMPGTLVDPASRNEDGTWIMIRFKDVSTLFDGFGWVARNLVQWKDEAVLDRLPVMVEAALTPTITFTPSATVPPTNTPEGQPVIPTDVPTLTPVPTDTNVPPTETPTLEPSATNTPEPSATFTLQPTDTPTIEATVTLITDVAVLQTITPLVPSITPLPLIEVVTDTPLSLPTATTAPVILPTVPTETATLTETATEIAALSTTVVIATPETVPPANNGDSGAGQTPPIGAIVAGVVVLSALVYIGMFAQGLAAARRYDAGFVVDTCPVCHRGSLTVETRRSRTLGIPGVRRTVRCSECRSVLREKGPGRWIYAVDRIENPALYERLNGREISDADLKKLG